MRVLLTSVLTPLSKYCDTKELLWMTNGKQSVRCKCPGSRCSVDEYVRVCTHLVARETAWPINFDQRLRFDKATSLVRPEVLGESLLSANSASTQLMSFSHPFSHPVSTVAAVQVSDLESHRLCSVPNLMHIWPELGVDCGTPDGQPCYSVNGVLPFLGLKNVG